jgi:two-component system, sensor histidine kinase and response regulator
VETVETNANVPVNILLVDDQHAKLLSYEAALAGMGENLLTATTAREALAILLETEVAVLLVDVCMPEMDGFDLVNMVRRHPRFRDTAIILASSIQVSDLDRLKGYDSGAMDYVPVPFVPELLRAKVRVFVDLFRKTRRLQQLNMRLEELVEERTSELRRSNQELEQFAYVASHDLQEPLRMISSFLQLLKERYESRLDHDADEFIGFASSGAQRMHAMINDLLTYARVNTTGGHFGLVSCDDALRQAIANLRLAIVESEATIGQGPMPTLRGDEVQIVQVFQNLIGNALKFRREGVTPVIQVECDSGDREWIFSVRDNGIGIEEPYRERIFQVFQRLHGREEYSGTGIGLSLCKKIVERHRGRIWVEDAPDHQGSVFRFTLPAAVEANGAGGRHAPLLTSSESVHPAGVP